MNVFRALLKFLIPYKWQALLAAFLGFLALFANIGLMGTSGYLIASAALHPSTILLLWVPIVGVRFFGLSRSIFRYFERLVSHNVTFRILAKMRVWLYEKVEPYAPTLLKNQRSGDILGTVVADIDTLQNLYLRVLAPPVIALFTIVSVFIIVANFSVTVAFTLVFFLLVAGIGIPLLSHLFAQHWGKALVKIRSALYVDITDSIAGMTELKVYNRVDGAVDQCLEKQNKLARLQSKMGTISAVSSGGMSFLTSFAMWVIMLITIPLVAQHQWSGVLFPAVLLIALASFEAIIPLPQAFQNYSQTMEAGRRLFRFVDQWTNNKDEVPVHDAAALSNQDTELVVQNLHFRYGSEQTETLQGIDFTLQPNKKIAIVGESGAGKSTLIQVLMKMHPYESGIVSLGGVELDQLSEDKVREQIAVVSQDTYLFNASVGDNLRIAYLNASLEEVTHAAKLAQIHEVIVRLPQGYDTIIGELGARLSGGERQRLSLARALLRQASIIIFDEPTTGLDAMTEQAFLQVMQTELQDKSILWITHRLAGMEQMDQILVMQQGRIMERGTHDTLIKRSGMYQTMWDLQQKRLQFI